MTTRYSRIAACCAFSVLAVFAGRACPEMVTISASADAGLEGRGNLRMNNNGTEPRAVVGQNDATDMTDRSRAVFRFDLAEYHDLTVTCDAVLTLTPVGVSSKLNGYSFLLYKMSQSNADWVEGVGRHPKPGKHVEGVAWERKGGSHAQPLDWQGDEGSFMDGLELIQSLKYGPDGDVSTGSPLPFTIPKGMMNRALAEGCLSVLLMSDVEGVPVRAEASFATKEHEVAERRPKLAFGEGELLYNGIRLPVQWPPQLAQLSREVMPVPYLGHPPEAIPIDVGRQLFVDDFLIESATLKRTYHRPDYHPRNPVLRPEKPWETAGQPGTMVFSDGVWYDPKDRRFKVWYQAPCGLPRSICHAVSRDGIHWERPSFGVRPGTNVVLPDPEGLFRDSVTVWLDLMEANRQRRYKLWRSTIEQKTVDGKRQMRKWLTLHFSPDGVHWTHVADSPSVGDRTTVFYNPFRKVWVLSLRTGYKGVGRARDYREHPDALAGIQWDRTEQYKWTCADRLDPHNPNAEFSHIPPQLYNLDAVAYESLMLGLFTIWQGDPRKLGYPRRRKRNEVLVGFSRDGFHWHRPSRERFIGVNETPGAWNWGNVQSAGGCCLVVGDKLYFYVSGRGVDENLRGDYVSTGLATLRRDGFASMGTDGVGGLTTRPVRFRGKRLFVNVDAPDGELRAEVLDRSGRVIEPFTRDNCIPVSGDRTLMPVQWHGADDLSAVAGKPVRLRFHLRNGSFYSFWVSSDASGASAGYVAAGGPGFAGPTDTAGVAAYRAAEAVGAGTGP